MSKQLIHCGLLAASLIGLGFTGAASAGKGGNNECPVDLVNALELDQEFGLGTDELTRCLERRHKVKVVVQINQFCRDAVSNEACTRPYALGNIRNMIKDYEITHGMIQGRDYEIVAVVHSGGGKLVLKGVGDNNDNSVDDRNQFEAIVSGLIADGVKFYFCQNTTRSYVGQGILPQPDPESLTGGATGELIEGVEYTTAGVTAIADFQRQGYTYVQP